MILGLLLGCAAQEPAADSGAAAPVVLELDTLLVHGGDPSTFDALGAIGLRAFALVDGRDAAVASAALARDLDAFELVVLDEGLAEEGLLWGEGSDAGLAALSVWVEGGGTLLSVGRSYEVAHALDPGTLDFVGEETVAGAAEVAAAQQVDAVVSDGTLTERLQAVSIEAVELGEGSAPIETHADPVGVHLRARVTLPDGTLPAAPLLTSARRGDGLILHSVPRLSGDAPPDFLHAVQYVVSDL